MSLSLFSFHLARSLALTLTVSSASFQIVQLMEEYFLPLLIKRAEWDACVREYLREMLR